MTPLLEGDKVFPRELLGMDPPVVYTVTNLPPGFDPWILSVDGNGVGHQHPREGFILAYPVQGDRTIETLGSLAPGTVFVYTPGVDDRWGRMIADIGYFIGKSGDEFYIRRAGHRIERAGRLQAERPLREAEREIGRLRNDIARCEAAMGDLYLEMGGLTKAMAALTAGLFWCTVEIERTARGVMALTEVMGHLKRRKENDELFLRQVEIGYAAFDPMLLAEKWAAAIAGSKPGDM